VASSETNETLGGHAPSWLAEVERWIDARIDRAGDIDKFHSYPWATALRVPTGDGQVWFKACIPELAHEVTTLELLSGRRPDLVPRLLAGDRERGWMLLADAGERMRELESQPGHVERWQQAVVSYAQLQLDVADDADAFVAGGVPDRRSTVTPQFAEAIEDDEVTKPPNGEALTDEEVDELRAIVPRLEAEEQQLDALGLPFSIQHDDLHDANIFIRNGEYRIIDWGDPCVANPLLSLTIALGALAYQLGVDRDAPDVARVRDAYLEPFTALCPHEELLAAMEMTIRVGHACGTIKWCEVIRAIPPESRSPYDEGIPKRLRRLLELCA
jgi:Phosphotransferase enzyme family